MVASALLAFYAMGVTAQSRGLGKRESSIRRSLGSVAVIPTGSMAPPLLLVVLACLDQPDRLGSLLVLVPVIVLMVFLTIQLSSFVLIEPPARDSLDKAEASRDWAVRRLGTFRGQSAKSVVLVLGANYAVAMGVGLAPVVLAPNNTTTALAPLIA